MLELEYRNGAVVLRFRTAEALDDPVLDALTAALAYIGPRPIVLTGTRTRFLPDFPPGHGTDSLTAACTALRRHRAPIVAAINGDAIGAGYALAECAGLRIMSAGVVLPPGRTRPMAPGDAVAAGLVDLQCPPARLLGLALRLAGSSWPKAIA